MSTASKHVGPILQFDAESYQSYWEAVPPEELEPYTGQFVALAPTENGWRIVAAASTLEDLIVKLNEAGLDSSSVVFDQVHFDDYTAVGVELQ